MSPASPLTVSTFRPAVRSAALARLIGEVADLTTADVCDRFGSYARVLDVPLRLFGRRRRFYGPVRTVRCHRDNGLVSQLLDDPGTGSILIVDGGGSNRSALLGDRLATVAAGQGWGGVIVNGAVRDSAQLETIDLGIAALGTSPQRSAKNGRGEVDVPVVLGGSQIRPGDVLIADADGVVVLDPDPDPDPDRIDDADGR